ncbi:X-box-binding protein 1 [Heteronotia binoei]|uniref:X-box-binding protein 1 n=1 Tax=Heteronotia binoei TaxID=13085 RepID=UPI002931C92C|nr:X-box-binding protein 1 [Heteronotia binoei]
MAGQAATEAPPGLVAAAAADPPPSTATPGGSLDSPDRHGGGGQLGVSSRPVAPCPGALRLKCAAQHGWGSTQLSLLQSQEGGRRLFRRKAPVPQQGVPRGSCGACAEARGGAGEVDVARGGVQPGRPARAPWPIGGLAWAASPNSDQPRRSICGGTPGGPAEGEGAAPGEDGSEASGALAMAPLPGPAAPRLLLLPAAPGPGASPPPRKRQRLAHLSAEEKALRRKLKNRVAAQSARDRKKARMGELERQALELEAQNQKLLAENAALRERTLRLALENRELRLRLGMPPASPRKAEETAEPPWELPPQQEQEEEEEEEEEEPHAGTGPAVAMAPSPGCVPLDGADGSAGSESDLLLGILDSLDPDMFLYYESPELAYLEHVQQQEEEEECAGQTDPLPPAPPFPLGPSPPKLEAINELIRFDHEYTKPFAQEASQPSMLGSGGSAAGVCLVPVKEEPADSLLPELGIAHLLAPDQKQQSLGDGSSSDSGYEGSPSPFSDLASPLGTDYGWDEAFANELFPQLISV